MSIPKILATKSGWIIATKVIRETPKAFICSHEDNRGRLKEHRIAKDSESSQLFDDVNLALAFAEGK